MEADWNKAGIKSFVSATLGCRCPAEVFEKIDISEHLPGARAIKTSRIVVGDRLLIYIVDLDSILGSVDTITLLANAGMNDRDTNHYNRFRLVIAGDREPGQEKNISGQFAELVEQDEKMHIHFVDADVLNNLQRSTPG